LRKWLEELFDSLLTDTYTSVYNLDHKTPLSIGTDWPLFRLIVLSTALDGHTCKGVLEAALLA
jgi:hypothetical protein